MSSSSSSLSSSLPTEGGPCVAEWILSTSCDSDCWKMENFDGPVDRPPFYLWLCGRGGRVATTAQERTYQKTKIPNSLANFRASLAS